jgi:hypothetical protein
MVVSDIKSMLKPLPTHYSRGEYSIPVTTTAEPLTDEYRRFWRYHGHYTLEFTKALMQSLPKDVKFVSYDHLNNKLTLIKL